MKKIILPVLLLAACARHEPADLVFRKGTVVTVDTQHPRAEAVAVAGGRIVYVGLAPMGGG